MAQNPLHKHSEFHENDLNKSFSKEEEGRIATDIPLWQEFKTGSETAFAAIYKTNVGRLYSYGLKLVYDKELVKDTIQDLFIELWDTKGRLGEIRSIKAYLYKCIRRKLIAKAAKHRKVYDRTKDLEIIGKTVPSIETSLLEKQHFDEQRKRLIKALNKLSDKQREVIHLKYYGRLNYNEITEVLSLDKKATYNLMCRSIRLLKQCMDSLLFLGIVLLLH